MLPNELLLQILVKLDDKTLLECRKVNVQFMVAADKILRDKRRFAVEIHVEKDKDVVFRDKWTKLRNITSAKIQAYLKDIDEEEVEDPVDYLPPFMTVGELHLDARSLSPARIGETVKILRAEGVQALRKVGLTWKNQHVNLFSLMKLIEEAPLKALDINWYNGGSVNSNSKCLAACLALMKSVGSKLTYRLSVRGPFSVAEMIDIMREDAVNCPQASFLFNKTRINAGDAPSAIRSFLESLRDSKRFCYVKLQSMRGRLTLPISEATRGFSGSFAFMQNGEEKTGNVKIEYEEDPTTSFGSYYNTAVREHGVIKSYEVLPLVADNFDADFYNGNYDEEDYHPDDYMSLEEFIAMEQERERRYAQRNNVLQIPLNMQYDWEAYYGW